MQAIWYDRLGEAREVLQFGELPTPAPGAGEVLVRLRASGVNPADCNRRAGRLGRGQEFPRVIPNSDGAGVVAAVGAGVDASWVGRRIWLHNGQRGRAFGTAAEYIALDHRLVAPLPDFLDFAAGACLGIPCMTAHQAVFRDGPVAGQTVLVTGGAGAVGHYAVQLARWGGARVIATVSSPAKAAEARAAGADVVIDYRTENVAARVMDATGGAGVERVVEVDFGGNLDTTLEVLKVNGVVAMYSSLKTREPVVPVIRFMFKAATVHFIQLGLSPLALRAQAQADIARWLAEAPGGGIHRVASRHRLADTAAAHEAVERGDKNGTVVVEIG
ncbi:MAG: NADPH:quinone reductase [Burkholderiales bacterium]|nr:NADPH:quinone reductase [Burkholderiales bacterium]